MTPDEVSRLERKLEDFARVLTEVRTDTAAAAQWAQDRPCRDHAGRLRGLEESRADQELAAVQAASLMERELLHHRSKVGAELSALRGKVATLSWLLPLLAFAGAMVPEGVPKIWGVLLKIAGG